MPQNFPGMVILHIKSGVLGHLMNIKQIFNLILALLQSRAVIPKLGYSFPHNENGLKE